MRVVVVGDPTSWYLRDLVRAASTSAPAGPHEVVPVTFRSLRSGIEANGRATFVADRADVPPLGFSTSDPVGDESRIASHGLERGSGPRRTKNESAEGPLAVDLMAADAVLVRSMPPGSLEQVIVRMDILGELERRGQRVLNPPRALETAIDKYLTLVRLAAVGLPVPETFVCQDRDSALAAFDALGGDVVVKPLFGSEGRGLTRITDPDLLVRAVGMLENLGAVLYLQRFIPHEGHDLRVFLLGDRVWSMRRIGGPDWRTNIARGGRGEAHTPTGEETDLARRAASVVGAPLAGVDLLRGPDGRLVVLEVNAVPGWKALAQVTGHDIAAEVWAYLVRLQAADGGVPSGSRPDRTDKPPERLSVPGSDAAGSGNGAALPMRCSGPSASGPSASSPAASRPTAPGPTALVLPPIPSGGPTR